MFILKYLQDTSKTQCKICLKFIANKALAKHMSAFHKESVKNLENNNNNNNISSTTTTTAPQQTKSRSRARSNNNPSSDKPHGCQYCKKSFVSPAKLRLHTAKFHAEERIAEAGHAPLDVGQHLMDTSGQDTRLRFYDDNSVSGPRYHSPTSSDGLPSQQVPEMEMTYMNSSPEDISEFGGGKELPGVNGNRFSGGGGGNTYSTTIPTIHIPEFENIQSKMGDNSEISTEAIQALLFP